MQKAKAGATTMSETQAVATLIGDIYDAALNPGLWDSVLRKVATFIGGTGGSLFRRDTASKTGGTLYDFGINDQFKLSYFTTYIKIDPTLVGYNLAPIGEPISTNDVIPYSDFVQTRFYKEWAVPQGWLDSLGVVLDRTATTSILLGVMRNKTHGMVDQATRGRARLLVPHLRRSILIGGQLEASGAKGEDLSKALDRLSAAAVFVDSLGRVLHTNLAGRELSNRGAVMQVREGMLSFVKLEADTEFRSTLAASANGTHALGSRGIAIPLGNNDGHDFIAHVLPLTTMGKRTAAHIYKASAVVFIQRAGNDAPSQPALIARKYKLTPTELRVLIAIVEIGGVPEIALSLGVAETTVKSHLASVFAKTGKTRQVDLAKLVASYASPVSG
jgi:DNA-binding CsgD family transcriptional regulator